MCFQEFFFSCVGFRLRPRKCVYEFLCRISPYKPYVNQSQFSTAFCSCVPLSDFGSKRFVVYVFRMDDSRWIKFLAIVTACLTVVSLALTIVLGIYVWRLDVLTDSLVGSMVASRRSTQLSSPTPEQSLTPTPTEAPVMKAIAIATPTLTPSPSPQPTQVPHRTHRRRHR